MKDKPRFLILNVGWECHALAGSARASGVGPESGDGRGLGLVVWAISQDLKWFERR